MTEERQGVGAGPDEDNGSALPPIWKRVIDLFFSPGQMFEALAEDPRWLGAVLLGAVVTFTSVILIPTELYELTMRAVLLERGQPLPDDTEQFARIQRTVGAVVAPVFWTIITLAVAGLSTVVFAFVLGDKGRFRQYFAAVTHAFLIASFGGLLITPLRIAAEDPQLLMSIGNAFVGILPDGYFLNVLRGLDIFAIWANIVLAIAVTKIDRRRSFGSAFTVYMVLSLGFAMIAANFI